MTSPRDLRSARAAAFTAVCVGLGVGAHAQMSGAGIPPWAVLAAAAGVFPAARLAARRECSMTVISVLMLSAQAAMHVMFAVAQQSAPAGTMQMPGMSMPGMPASPGGGLGHALAMSPAMLCAHTAAALLCAAALRLGEAALHLILRAVQWVHRRLAWPRALHATAECAHLPHLPGRGARSDALRPRLTGSVLTRRGPPGFQCPA
ncbi:MAG TPA: hypothetical protein VGM10_13300 [Actinocrinis sp.]